MFDWGNDQVLLWLRNANYTESVLECFRTHNITGLVLPMLNTQELKDMGIKNLKLRLILMKQISELLVSKDIQLVNMNVEHPLLSEVQSLVDSTNLIESVAQSIVVDTQNQSQNKMIIAQLNKLKEDVLPIIKESKDRKPLPHPYSSETNTSRSSLPRSGSGNVLHRKNSQRNASNSNQSSSDTLKQLKAKTEDPCYKILQSAMKSHHLNKSDWQKYVLVICYGGDKERVLQYDEKPVAVFKELNDLGLNPSMMLRQVDVNAAKDGSNATPGGYL